MCVHGNARQRGRETPGLRGGVYRLQVLGAQLAGSP
jgi:hypothetical protein